MRGRIAARTCSARPPMGGGWEGVAYATINDNNSSRRQTHLTPDDVGHRLTVRRPLLAETARHIYNISSPTGQ
jgi:hypothetical protein